MPVDTPYRQLLFARDLKANMPSLLGESELFYCTDTHELFEGTGTANLKVDINYFPAVPANWQGTPPNNLISAMDRVAAALVGLLGGGIP
jgi:hypothetical protein